MLNRIISVDYVTRKYNTLVHSPGYGGRWCDSPAQSTIVVSRIMEREAVSLQPSLLVQVDTGMGEPHSLLSMYASAERHTCDHDWY